MSEHTGIERVEQWFADRGIEPFAFQRETWNAYLAGESGLIQAPTGMGKTLAAALGPMIEFCSTGFQPVPRGANRAPRHGLKTRATANSLTMLWITPLRALASDTVEALSSAIEALNLPWSVELRT